MGCSNGNGRVKVQRLKFGKTFLCPECGRNYLVVLKRDNFCRDCFEKEIWRDLRGKSRFSTPSEKYREESETFDGMKSYRFKRKNRVSSVRYTDQRVGNHFRLPREKFDRVGYRLVNGKKLK